MRDMREFVHLYCPKCSAKIDADVCHVCDWSGSREECLEAIDAPNLNAWLTDHAEDLAAATALRAGYPDAPLPPPTVNGKYTPKGQGSCKPNRWMNGHIRLAALEIQQATYLYCESLNSNARDLPADHPLARALAALAEADRETTSEHEPHRFRPYKPTEEAKHRWDVQ